MDENMNVMNEEVEAMDDVEIVDAEPDEGNAAVGIGILLGAGAVIGIVGKTVYDKFGKPVVEKAKAKIAAKRAAKIEMKNAEAEVVTEDLEVVED